MLAKKMAGFFTVLGVVVFLGAWLYNYLDPDIGGVPMAAETAWEVGIYLAAGFFMLGLFVSTLGVALVQEALAETRGRDMERKLRAKTTYDRIVNLSMDPEAAVSGGGGTDQVSDD